MLEVGTLQWWQDYFTICYMMLLSRNQKHIIYYDCGNNLMLIKV